MIDPQIAADKSKVKLLRKLVRKTKHLKQSSEKKLLCSKDAKVACNRVEEVSVNGTARKCQMIQLTEGRYNVAWVCDADAKSCMRCDARFSFFFRRHHCRLCGYVTCGRCSNVRLEVVCMKETGGSRVCNECLLRPSLSSYTVATTSHRDNDHLGVHNEEFHGEEVGSILAVDKGDSDTQREAEEIDTNDTCSVSCHSSVSNPPENNPEILVRNVSIDSSCSSPCDGGVDYSATCTVPTATPDPSSGIAVLATPGVDNNVTPPATSGGAQQLGQPFRVRNASIHTISTNAMQTSMAFGCWRYKFGSNAEVASNNDALRNGDDACYLDLDSPMSSLLPNVADALNGVAVDDVSLAVVDESQHSPSSLTIPPASPIDLDSSMVSDILPINDDLNTSAITPFFTRRVPAAHEGDSDDSLSMSTPVHNQGLEAWTPSYIHNTSAAYTPYTPINPFVHKRLSLMRHDNDGVLYKNDMSLVDSDDSFVASPAK